MVIAAVAVDVALPHLDRSFDYRVPQEMVASIRVGQRVRVRFAGRIVLGFVRALHDDASHATAEIRAIVGEAIALQPDIALLVRAVADRYASTFADVVRFAVPPRHARAESAALAGDAPAAQAPRALDGPLAAVLGFQAFLTRCARGERLAAACEIPAGLDLEVEVARAAAAALAAGHVIVAAPDVRSVERICEVLRGWDIDPIVMQTSDGPSVRQRAFTRASRSARAIVVGTRSAVFAPLSGYGTTVVVGDGNDALVEQHSPGWHAREVALLRGATAGWSTLCLARHRSLEIQAHLHNGVMKALTWPVETWRAASVHAECVPERLDAADPMHRALRIPSSVFTAIRRAVPTGPVVLAVAHRGYVNALACGQCREPARCSACSGTMALAAATDVPRCTVCGQAAWTCPWCGSTRIRHQRIGGERTRDELGRAFPDVPIRVVDAEHPLDTVGDTPGIFIVTPGAEPHGHAALVVIVDADVMLARHDLGAATESLRRWCDVAAMVATGGRLLIVGPPSAPAVQALVRADPAGFAEREFGQRLALGLPPAVHVAVVEAPPGSPAATEVAAAVPAAVVLGPMANGAVQRTLVLGSDLASITHAARSMIATRSAAKTLAGIGVRIDPLDIAT